MFVDSQPAFSPDGRTLSFIREVATGVRDIYLLTVSDAFQPIGGPKRITFENQLVFRPVWTLDGREILFSSGLYLSPNLFRIKASGLDKPQRLAGVGEDGSEVAISRRTHRLVYTRELFDANVWRLEVPGPHGKVSSPEKLISSTRNDWEAQFSPDGTKVVFNSNRTGSSEIWICDSDGSNAQPLTALGNYCGSPSWSPDGQRIAFDSLVERQWEIYVISIDGGKPKRLTTNPASDALARWSHDGKWIYFASDRTGENEIWKIPTSGGEAVRVTQKGGFEAFESPDGKFVYYTKSEEGAEGLWRMPRNGGEETKVLESVAARGFAVVKEGIYFIPRPTAAGRYSIQFLDFATKRIRSISTIESEIGSYLSFSPNGRWILYSQIDQRGSDLMLVENFR
jgi:Tol biopolymer transport system component